MVGLGTRNGGRSLRDVLAVSGDLPVYGEPMLRTLRWISTYYVAPLAAVLPRAAPPNLPRLGEPRPPVGEPQSATSRLPQVTSAAASGGRLRPHYLVSGSVGSETLTGLVSDVSVANRSAMVVAPTVVEAERIAAGLRNALGNRVMTVHSSLAALDVTRSWTAAATTPGLVVVGTREIALWPVRDLALAVVVEEGRRAMKAPQTPTMHVRETIRRRAVVERFQLAYVGPVPTLETLAAGSEVVEPAGRVWPLVEVADRNDEPPGTGFVSERVRRALAIAIKDGKTAFVLVNRRGYAPAFRCVRCRTLRRCEQCGSAAGRSDVCLRCSSPLGRCVNCDGARFEPLGAGIGRVVDDVRRSLGDVAAVGDRDAAVTVGTERDLPAVSKVDLAVAVDADGLIFAPNYRAGEDALRLLARLAARVRPGRGNRCIVQTASPVHPVIAALRSGHPIGFLEDELQRRADAGFPPAGDLMAIEVGDAPGDIDTDLRSVAAQGVRGPAVVGDRQRWLLEGPDLRAAKIRLRRLVQKWRDAGARVRVDVDPLDL